MKHLLISLCLITMGACSHSQPDYFSHEQLDPIRESVFHSKLASVAEYFEALKSVGAMACLPGQVALIDRQLNSVRLESNAQLWPEAIMRLDQLTDEVDALICKLQSIQNTTKCSMNNDDSVPLTQWYLKASLTSCEASESQQSVPHLIADITLFETDSHELTEVARVSLTEWWQFVAGHYSGSIVISGHTDSRGTAEYNQILSFKRANAVADYLIGLGIDDKRITVRAMGEAEPRVEESNDFNRQLNRRVAVEAEQSEERL